MAVTRLNHAAVLLPNGNVLVAGGSDPYGQALSSVEIYNSTTRMFASAQSMACERSGLSLTLLPSGQVLAAGGTGSAINECPLVCELYDPASDQWTSTRLLNTIHSGHTTILINNSVLLIGGVIDYGSPDQLERYEL